MMTEFEDFVTHTLTRVTYKDNSKWLVAELGGSAVIQHGQLLYDDMLKNDRNFNFNLMTWEGSLFWVATLRAEIGHRRVSSDVTMTLLVKNSSGVTIDFIEPYVMGATIPS